MKTKSIAIANISYTIQKKDVKRLKTNGEILSAAEIKTIQKLGLNPDDLTYDDVSTILKFKQSCYEYLKLCDEAIPAFLSTIENVINNQDYVIPDTTYEILINNNFEIDSEIVLIKDIEVEVEGKQRLVLTNSNIDKKFIKLLDKSFINNKYTIKSVNTTNINFQHDKKVLRFGCKAFSFATTLDIISSIRETIINLAEIETKQNK